MGNSKPMLKTPEALSVTELQGAPLKLSSFKQKNANVGC